jgi:hypothetical protein
VEGEEGEAAENDIENNANGKQKQQEKKMQKRYHKTYTTRALFRSCIPIERAVLITRTNLPLVEDMSPCIQPTHHCQTFCSVGKRRCENIKRKKGDARIQDC